MRRRFYGKNHRASTLIAAFFVDNIPHFRRVGINLEVFDEDLERALHVARRRGRVMGRDQKVRRVPEGRVRGERFFAEYVERRAANGFFAQTRETLMKKADGFIASKAFFEKRFSVSGVSGSVTMTKSADGSSS